MNSDNLLKSVESSEKQPEESPEEPSGPGRKVDPARVEELEDQVSELEEQLAGVEGEDTEEEKPEPDYACSGEDCEGFAVEETEPQHVDSEETLMHGPVVHEVECPRCGEAVSPEDIEVEEGAAEVGFLRRDRTGKAVKQDMAGMLSQRGRRDLLDPEPEEVKGGENQ